MKSRTRNQRESFSILGEILKTIVWPVIFAIVSVIVLAVINYLLEPYIIASQIQFLNNLDQETSKDILGIIAQVAPDSV